MQPSASKSFSHTISHLIIEHILPSLLYNGLDLTTQVYQTMEPTTDLVLCSKANDITTVCVPRAHRHPTPLDWERWIPTIKTRYKSEPARVIIDEMNAEGLHVTEKMFRDRLRRWRMNDKNRPSAAYQKRTALQSADNGDKTSKHGSRYNKIGRNSPRPAMLGHESTYNQLHTPKEILVLHRTLKGVLDWQQSREKSRDDPHVRWNHPDALNSLLQSMLRCLEVNAANPFTCKKTMPHLWRTSMKLQRYMVTCTPPEILSSINSLSYLVFRRDSSPWYDATSRFLVNAAVEVFPDSHPSLLLLRLLFSNLTSSQLVIVYEVGSNVIEQYNGKARSFSFRARMHSAASWMGLSATMRPYADALCADTPDATSSRRLLYIASLYRSIGQNGKFADALRRCLAQCEDEGDKDSSTVILALQLLAYVHSEQNDFLGEETALQKMLKSTLARDRRKLRASQLSIDTLISVTRLDAFYARHGLDEQRDALHMEYPSAFELRVNDMAIA